MVTSVLQIRLSDLFRATMAEGCGNEGYIGIAPDGSQYHVVVPVDRQIARGLKAWIQPDDGTPFGGYKGWRYFCCLTHVAHVNNAEERKARLAAATENGWLLRQWGQTNGLEIEIIEDMRPT